LQGVKTTDYISLRRADGFTLVEIFISLAVVTVGVSALMKLWNLQLHADRESQARNELVRLAQTITYDIVGTSDTNKQGKCAKGLMGLSTIQVANDLDGGSFPKELVNLPKIQVEAKGHKPAGILVQVDSDEKVLTTSATGAVFVATSTTSKNKAPKTIQVTNISLFQDLPTVGFNPKYALLRYQITARPYLARTGEHWEGKEIEIGIPFIATVASDGTIGPCPDIRGKSEDVERQRSCVRIGGIWQGDPYVPPCLLP
jgi:Tfp pilus assembly protein PilV